MKRIETVITPWSLDTFKEVAPKIGISEFNLIEVYSTGRTTVEERKRLYRGTEYTTDLLPRLKIEFVLFDDNVKATLHQLLVLVQPESIAVFKVDQTLWPARGTRLPSQCHATNLTTVPTTGRNRESVSRGGCTNSDHSLGVAFRNGTDNGNNGNAR
jgi:nitrogen regulatory protein PII